MGSTDGVQRFLRLALDADDTGGPETPRASDIVPAAPSASPKMLSAELAEDLRARAHQVEFPDYLLRVMSELREYLEKEAEPPYMVSDRRMFKAVRLIRVAAAAVGASTVVEADLLLLRHVLWDRHPEQGD